MAILTDVSALLAVVSLVVGIISVVNASREFDKRHGIAPGGSTRDRQREVTTI